MPFDPALRTRVLLWCDRHCCLCKKPCGVNIEVDHIVPEAAGGTNDLNALQRTHGHRKCGADRRDSVPKCG